jgi:hypothetical protein
MSFEETTFSTIRRQTTHWKQSQTTQNQVFETHEVQKDGRDRFSLSRPNYKRNVTALSAVLASKRYARALRRIARAN